MKRSNYTSEQVTYPLKQDEAVKILVPLCRKMGGVRSKFLQLEEEVCAMGVSDVRELGQQDAKFFSTVWMSVHIFPRLPFLPVS